MWKDKEPIESAVPWQHGERPSAETGGLGWERSPMQKGSSVGKVGYVSSLGSATKPSHAMTEATEGQENPAREPPTTYQVISDAVPQDVELHQTQLPVAISLGRC